MLAVGGEVLHPGYSRSIILKEPEIADIRILIVDDSKNYSKILSELMKMNAGIEVVGIAHDGMQAIKLIDELKPDVVLLDILMPVLDGIGVLEWFADVAEKPKFIVYTGFSQEDVIYRAIELGVSYIILKPFDHNLLMERIKEFSTPDQFTAVSRKSRTGYDLSNEVSSIMHEIGIPVHIKGYNYLREAIIKACEDRNLLGALTKELYPKIAAQFDTSSSKVERSIRNAIKLACTRGNYEMIKKIFQYSLIGEEGKPTNGQFISTIADKIISEGVR
ncbi:MAG: sporulation transcription factor Spo0A [Peptococcaceae bacterium]|nr:sporulation transcription factor Spo0A [Peptococcaceae bacterium]